ncbi:LOW QUALITY PROTEIN: uncharacterized protein LOC127814101 [Diospyros lotus]|uniref:LOW QUALITY PROTEIN: uncharacterized protein LOC127814101 n=1 Tax=Diospyros lotus TaxID=55363 RepID=UPI0022570F8C|nr:LOW QUALITY PROTEIN: uncharacterized protein LOC127814101 [Diospyros lotus]
MEPAKIDWKAIDSVFEVDDLYEHINAPTWVDFSAPDQPLDDESWFCKPDCNHPKTVDDFLKGSPPSKLQRLAATVSEILPSGNRNRRDGNLKRRGLVQPSLHQTKTQNATDLSKSENQNPNFSSTPTHQYTNAMKAAMKSSTEKKPIDDSSQREPRPQLKSTLSARNLFAGRDIVNQITEFCNELKRLATRGKERENVERPNEEKSSMAAKKREDNLPGSDERKKERKPLLEVSKEKCESIEKDCVKEKQRRKKWAEDAENIPIISVDLKNVKHKEGDSLLQIRTCPPSPQGFSADRGPTKAIPLKASRCKPLERRGILEELKQSNAELKKEEAVERSNQAKMASVVAERGEARSLDVFWFLKPCTLSS